MTLSFVAPRVFVEGRRSAVASSPGPAAEVRCVHALDASRCHALADAIVAADEAGQSWASRTRYAAGTPWDVNQQFRRSKNVSPELDGLSLAFESMHRCVAALAEELGIDAGMRLHPVESQCLVYREGDRIGDHADDSALDEAENGEPAWRVIKPQRHVAAVLWLTTQTTHGLGRHEFSGGTFRFNSVVDSTTREPLDIAPSAGQMVVFPANPWFRHEVLPVQAGTRIALARWWQARPLAPAADVH